LSDEKKIGVVVLWKNNDAYWELTPEKLAKWVEEGNDIFERCKEKVKRVVSYHAVGMGRFDGFEIWECTDIGDWEALNEEVLRWCGKYLEYYKACIGINEPYFAEATKNIPFFAKLKRR
jgi:hypothetical protein